MNYRIFLNVTLTCFLYSSIVSMEKQADEKTNEAHKKLWTALTTRDFDTINRLIIEKVANINTTDEYKNTPLIIIASDWKSATSASTMIHDPLLRKVRISKQIAVVVRLLNAGAHIDAKNQFNQTALTKAIENNNDELVMTLVEQKAYIPSTYKSELLKKAIYYRVVYPCAVMVTINPVIKLYVKENIETLFDMASKQSSYLSRVPKDILAIIMTYAYPECAQCHRTLQSYNPTTLVDILPLETLNLLITNDVLDYETICDAWGKKLENITNLLPCIRSKEDLPVIALQFFKIQTLEKIRTYLQPKSKNH
jgi:hypothetical protein